MRIISILLGSILILFALVQFNDPDPFLWILYYGLVGFIGLLLGIKKQYSQALIIAFGLIAIFWAITLFHGFLEFIKSNEGINSAMSEVKYFIEEAREFLGLMISLGVLIFYYSYTIQLKKKNNKVDQIS